ncbi:sigma-70 family RNA polymerase sigma factor [Novipirellula artificiosorum]|uniref:RNA polymerase sigma factor RpoE n=1 Tax=Novipirellula artificiosorum TaxID=2528016 RepID=A0A5C6D9A3_9BACT|nr:sigma-70 family RNA polymerase sigma factor [Novipirellula artificiosorum]TWU31796.1 RNA polymerase sigma factor RpoE [Novipirellula artificiosorum]
MKRTPEFIQLLTSSQSRLYGYIMSLVLDPDQASDVLQQTNAILWEREENFELGTNFIAWSFRIAYYQVLAHRKQQQRDRLTFDTGLLSDLAQVASDRDEVFETRQRMMRQCLEKLNSRQGEFIQRRYYAGSTLESIASETEMTINAVKQLLFRARNALTRCIDASLEREASS